MENQKGLIKEIIIIGAVIFILAYFSIDPQNVIDKIISLFDRIVIWFGTI